MLNRRTFLRASSAAAGGMLMTLYIDLPARVQSPASPTYPPEAFIHVRPDGTIVIQVNRLEFGQGVQTALPMILADELDADWSHVVGELAPAADVYKDPIYQLQMTGGSISVPHSFQQYRELGAKMRAMLVATAADRWRVLPAQCRTESSVVYGPANQSVRYADLASDAARRPVPGEVRLKTPSEFRLIGTPVRRLDSRAKCDGSLRFGIDVDLPGLKVALVARPPVYGGRVKSLNDREARAVAGVRDVFEVPVIRDGTGIAVVADTFWMAKQARDRLNIEWDLSGVEHADTSQMQTRYAELSRTTGNVAVNRGDATVLDQIPAADRIVGDFSFPYLAHTPMEPLNTTIRFDGDHAEAWVPSQFQTMDQIAIAEVLGLKPDQVTFHTEYAGGGFGRRTPLDSHVQREAASIAKRMRGTPVKVVWTREDDVQGGYYRPMFVHHVEVGVGPRGTPAAWRHVIVGQSHIIGTGPPWEGALVKKGVDELVVEGTADSRYAIPNFHVSAHQPTINVPVAQWRSVGMTHNAFVMETLIDELAVRAKIDPIAYRLALLSPDAKKLRNPLALLEEKTKAWRFRVPRNHAVGIACNEYHQTGVACAVEVSVENGRPRIHRATVTADVGMAINPLTLEAQFQGGIVYGLSQLVAGGAITFSDGRVDQRNFDGHAPPYMKDAPVAIDVHIVPSTEPPTACGECPVPVICPAVVNALFRLTGKRYRTLPLDSI
jgi:isoquinoline 1-oxidoreductase beta subunit